MPLQIRLGGAWVQPTGLKIFSGGAWRTIQNVKIYADGAWQDVANFTTPSGGGGGGGGTLDLTLSRSFIAASGLNSTVSSGTVTATPSGGLAPYTYSWVKQSGDSISAVSPTSASTIFRATGMAEDEQRSALFRCTCTDSLGASDTADVTVDINRRSSSGS